MTPASDTAVIDEAGEALRHLRSTTARVAAVARQLRDDLQPDHQEDTTDE